MTAMIDDATALRQYASDASEAAFALLVRRHADWVYSTALRQVGDPAAAEDVTQAAFILLARKAAKLSRETHLSGWLFNVVRYEAKFIKRSQRRRLANERAAAVARRACTATDVSPAWEEIAPLLDDAVARLSSADRQGILLRFYQRMSFAAVGAAMNTSEEAARKRVDRAVIKLRQMLLAQGVDAPVTSLAQLMLSGPMVHAAPATITAAAALVGQSGGFLAMNLAAHAQRMLRYARWKLAAGLIGIVTLAAAGVAAHSVLLADAAAPATSQPAAPVMPATPPPVEPAIPPATTNVPPATQPAITTETFVGRVVDPDGHPSGGATVWAQYRDPDDSSSRLGPMATSAADGTFSLGIARRWPSSDYAPSVQVVTHADGFGWGGGRLVGHRPLDIELPRGEYMRAVFGDPTGAPAAGLVVDIASLRPQTDDADSTVTPVGEIAARLRRVTDATGAAEWHDLPREWSVSLTWTDPRFAQPLDTGTVELPDAAATAGDTVVQLRPAATIRGHVTYATTHQPAAGVPLRTVGETVIGDSHWIINEVVTTDADGNYALTQLLPGSFGIALDSVPGAPFQRDWTTPAITGVGVAAVQEVIGQDFVLQKGGVITGIFTDTATGAPLAGAIIGIDGPAHPRNVAGAQSDESNSAGQYLLRVPPGLQHLQWKGGPTYYALAGGADSDGRDLTVADGQTIKFDFQLRRLAPTDARIGHATVVFDDGSPAAGARIIFSEADGGGGRMYTAANRDGQFPFDASKTYLFRARLGLFAAEPMTSHGGAELKLILSSNMHQPITGRVVDQDGHPVSGAKIHAYTLPDATSTVGACTTDADGVFRLASMWADTDYRVYAVADGYSLSWKSLVRHDGKYPPLEFKLKAGTIGR
jgi:RNA polymerase sigma factor (sigma-70 family)